MKQVVSQYIPFEHENLEFKNNLINFARDQASKGSLEGLMASVVIYSNLVEYLSASLVKTFNELLHWSSYYTFSGFFFRKIINKQKKPELMSQIINELEKFEFPDKIDFVENLKQFSSARNNLFHRLFNIIDQENVTKKDPDFIKLSELAELILQKYNVISTGITKQWISLTTTPPSSISVDSASSKTESTKNEE